MRKSLLTILVAVAMAGAVLGGPLVSSAYADEQFRADLLQFIREMRGVAATLAQQGSPDQTAALAEAEQLIRSLSPEQLAILEAAFARSPNWREMPAILDALMTRKGAQRKMLERHRRAETLARPTIRPVSVPLLASSAADPWAVGRAAFPEGVMPFQTFAPPEPEVRPFRNVVLPRLRAAGLR